MGNSELPNKESFERESRFPLWSELVSGSGLNERIVDDITEMLNSASKKEDSHGREVTPEVDFLHKFAFYLRAWFEKTLEWDDAEKKHVRTGETNNIVLDETETMIINLYRELRKDAIDGGFVN